MGLRIDERNVDLETTAQRLVDIATELLTVARQLRAQDRGEGDGLEPDAGGLDPDGPIEELVEPRYVDGSGT